MIEVVGNPDKARYVDRCEVHAEGGGTRRCKRFVEVKEIRPKTDSVIGMQFYDCHHRVKTITHQLVSLSDLASDRVVHEA